VPTGSPEPIAVERAQAAPGAGTARPLRVLKVFFSGYPWEVRAEKICRSLMGAGHAVTLLCRNDRLQPRREDLGGLQVMRIHPLRIGPRALNALWNSPVPFSPVWAAHITHAVAEARPDVVLVREIPLAVPSALAAHSFGAPVVLDMAENYPAAIAEWGRWERGGWGRRLRRNVAAARLLERLSVAVADHVLVVAQEQADRLTGMGLPAGRVSLVGNTPELDRLQEAPAALLDDLQRRFRGRTVLLYVGELHLHRGLDTAICAIRHLRDALPDPLLLLLGTGLHQETLRRIAASEARAGAVHFEGWVEPSSVAAYVAACQVALVPHRVSEHTNTTLPNKLFDFMAQGRPVVVSDAAPMARIVAAEACGTVFRSGDAASLAEAVRRAADPEQAGGMGARGREAVLREYHWGCDFQRLCGALAAVARAQGRAGGRAQ